MTTTSTTTTTTTIILAFFGALVATKSTTNAFDVAFSSSNGSLPLLSLPQPASLRSYKLVCYVTNWSQYRAEPTKFTPSHVDPHLCTHLIFAFAAINLTSYEIRSYEWNDETQYNKSGKNAHTHKNH